MTCRRRPHARASAPRSHNLGSHLVGSAADHFVRERGRSFVGGRFGNAADLEESRSFVPMAEALLRCLPRVSDVIHSCHVVNFDVDEGHVLEWSSSTSALNQADGNNLCLQAMPDSQPVSGGLGDMRFAFRFFLSATKKPLWGFSFFRARRTAEARRGVFQKALVLLTPLPLFELFRAAVALLAETYFAHGVDALRDGVKELQQWPTVLAAGTHTVPLLGQTLSVKCVTCEPGPVYSLPASGGGLWTPRAAPGGADSGTAAGGDELAGGAMGLREARATRALCPLGESCWTLWQLMLTGESLAVLTPSPHQCSDIVLALPALIAPLACMSDLRPYLCVHAPEWDQQLAGKGPPPGSGVLAGATNPMLARAPPPWLTLLTSAEPPTGGGGGGGGSGGSGSGGGGSGRLSRNSSFTQNLGLGWMFGEDNGGGGSGGGGDGEESPFEVSWTTSVEVAVRPDERVLRQLRGLSSPATERRSAKSAREADDEDGRARLLREHFEQLTASFLQPLCVPVASPPHCLPKRLMHKPHPLCSHATRGLRVRLAGRHSHRWAPSRSAPP